jgi:hypothetical protein
MAVSLVDLVPQGSFNRHLEATLDMSLDFRRRQTWWARTTFSSETGIG